MCSCSVYRNYKRPENIVVANSYKDVDSISVDSTNLATVSWRELFTDKALQSLIDSGLKQNTDLQIAYLRIEQAEAVLQSSRLAYLPSLNLAPQGSISSFDGTKPAKTYSLAASATWEIDLFGKIRNATKGDKTFLLQSRAYRQAVQTNLIASIANNYYTLLRLDAQLDINRQTLKNWEENIRVLKALKSSGDADDIAINRAEANHLALQNSILGVVKSIKETETAISTLIGSEPLQIIRSSLLEQEFPETISAGVPIQLLANRPDIVQSEYKLANAFYATNVARAAFYPTISLSGSAGWTNNAGSAIVNPGSLLWNAAASLLQPIFDKGKNRANLIVAKSQQQEALLEFQQSILDAGKEVNDALSQWQIAQQQIELSNKQVVALSEAVRKTEVLMKHSSVNYLDVLTAQQSLLQAQQSNLQNRFDKIQGIINLYHALGGGVE